MPKYYFKAAVTAALFGVTLLLSSCVVELPLTEGLRPITEQEAGLILNIQATGAELYETLTRQGDPLALDKTVAWLRAQPQVQDSDISADGTIWIQYTCGLEGSIFG